VVLTPMGAMFLRRAMAVRSELQRARDELVQLRGSAQGQLHVALSAVPHMVVLGEVLNPFWQRYPEVRLDMLDALLPSVEQDLRDGTVDLYIGPVIDGLPGDLIAERLFDATRVVIGRKGHPLSHARSVRELADAQWISTPITHRAEEELKPLFTDYGLPPPQFIMRAHSTQTFLFTIMNTDLLMLLPIQWTQAPLVRDAVQRIHVKEPLASPPICIVRRAGLPMTPAAEYFCDMVRRVGYRLDNKIRSAQEAEVA
jgi:LysR family transcriptional regulator, regulator of abg operon